MLLDHFKKSVEKHLKNNRWWLRTHPKAQALLNALSQTQAAKADHLSTLSSCAINNDIDQAYKATLTKAAMDYCSSEPGIFEQETAYHRRRKIYFDIIQLQPINFCMVPNINQNKNTSDPGLKAIYELAVCTRIYHQDTATLADRIQAAARYITPQEIYSLIQHYQKTDVIHSLMAHNPPTIIETIAQIHQQELATPSTNDHDTTKPLRAFQDRLQHK